MDIYEPEPILHVVDASINPKAAANHRLNQSRVVAETGLLHLR
jgi:hypothetical protein